MLATPAQLPAVSYPYRVKRKPVPRYDFDPSYSETDLKGPFICSNTTGTRSVDDFTSDLPRLPYHNRKPPSLYALPTDTLPPVNARDITHSWSDERRNHCSEIHSIDIPSMGYAPIPQRRPSPDRPEPHYHKRTQSTPTIFQGTSPSSLGTSPPPYIYSHLQFDVTNSKDSFPPPILGISPEGAASFNMDTTIDRTSNSSVLRDHAFDGGHSFASISSHTPAPPVNRPLSMKRKEEMFAWLLRPIRLSLGMGKMDGTQFESRRPNTSHQPSPRLIGPRGQLNEPTQSQPRVKRNVLRAPRRQSPGVLSRTTGTTLRDKVPPTPRAVEFGVDAELENFTQQRDLVPPFASPHLAMDLPSWERIPFARPQSSSGFESPRLRPRTHSYSLQQISSTRPTTVPATFVAPVGEDRIPTHKQLSEAASLPVIAESGVRVYFGDLFLRRKIVVIFIRHFWCPNCQDYMFSISNTVNPAELKRAGVDLVIIGNGSYNMIQSYRKIFRTSFTLYTDPTHEVYKALGMTLRSLDPGPESQRGAYVRHGLASGIAMVVLNAFKVKMPVWENGGDIEQLGGEFVLGPGLNCTFAHRMGTTRSHVPIQRVLAAAGVDLYERWEMPASISRQPFLITSEAEEVKWMVKRDQSLVKLRNRKRLRRAGEISCRGGTTCEGLRENLREEFTAGAISIASLSSVDDEAGMSNMVTIGRQSKPETLVVDEQKMDEDYDKSREEEEDQHTVDSADTSFGPTDGSISTSPTSDAGSLSSSTLYQECSSEKHSNTDDDI